MHIAQQISMRVAAGTEGIRAISRPRASHVAQVACGGLTTSMRASWALGPGGLPHANSIYLHKNGVNDTALSPLQGMTAAYDWRSFSPG